MKKAVKVFSLLCSLMVLVPVMFINIEVSASANIPDGLYYIQNKNTGKRLDVYAFGSTNYSKVVQWRNTRQINQYYRITYINNEDSYLIEPCNAPGMAIDVYGARTSNDAQIQIYQDNNTNAQRFRFASNGLAYAITTKCSNYSKCITVKNASTSDGADIIQYTNNNTDNALWYIVPAMVNIATYNTSLYNYYDREDAAEYAIQYGPNRNASYGNVGNNCTAFASQSMHDGGGIPFTPPNPIFGITNRNSINNWFHKTAGGSNWVTPTWSVTDGFYNHYTSDDFLPYQILLYECAQLAYYDMRYITFIISAGDIMQFGTASPSENDLWQHAIVFTETTDCNGYHRDGQASEEECMGSGKTELIYSQNQNDYKGGHLYWLMRKLAYESDFGNPSVIFYRINSVRF